MPYNRQNSLKEKLGVFLALLTFVGSPVQAETIKANDASKEKVSFFDFCTINAKKSNFEIGYDIKFHQKNKIQPIQPNLPSQNLQTKGCFHGPRFSILQKDFSGYIKLGPMSNSFSGLKYGIFKGPGIELGCKANIYDENDLTLSFELVYFKGRGSNKARSYHTVQSSPSPESNHIPMRMFGKGIHLNVGKWNGHKIGGLITANDQGKIIHENGTEMGFIGEDNQWFLYNRNPSKQADSADQQQVVIAKNFAKALQRNISTRLIAAKRMEKAHPFLGLEYNAEKYSISSTEGNFKYKNKNKFGVIFGANFSSSRNLDFGIEGQFLNKRSLSFSGNYRF